MSDTEDEPRGSRDRNGPAAPPSEATPSTGTGCLSGTSQFVFVAVFAAIAMVITSQTKRDGRPTREQIVGRTWVQGSPDGRSQIRRRFDDDGTAVLERRTHTGRPWESDPFETSERRSGHFEYTAPDRIDVRFDDGTEEHWTVRRPSDGSLHLGGTGLAGGGFVDAGQVPSYAPTHAK